MASSIGNSVSPGTLTKKREREASLDFFFCKGRRESGECTRTYPAVLLRLLPTLAVFAHPNDDVEAIVARIQALSVALRAIADEGKRVIFEVVLQLSEGPVAALIHDLLAARKVERLDAANGLYERNRRSQKMKWWLGNKRRGPQGWLFCAVRWRRRRSAPTASSWPRLQVWRRACWRCGGHGEKQREKEVVRSGMLGKPCRQFEQRRTTTDTDRQLFFFFTRVEITFFFTRFEITLLSFSAERIISRPKVYGSVTSQPPKVSSTVLAHVSSHLYRDYRTFSFKEIQQSGIKDWLSCCSCPIRIGRIVLRCTLTADWFSCATLSRTWLA